VHELLITELVSDAGAIEPLSLVLDEPSETLRIRTIVE
jgi:hypothetical protein